MTTPSAPSPASPASAPTSAVQAVMTAFRCVPTSPTYDRRTWCDTHLRPGADEWTDRGCPEAVRAADQVWAAARPPAPDGPVSTPGTAFRVAARNALREDYDEWGFDSEADAYLTGYETGYLAALNARPGPTC